MTMTRAMTLAARRLANVKVEVRIGPLPATSASSWVDYARSVLDAIQGHATPVAPLEARLAAAFGSYLEQWGAIASAMPTFEWSGQMERDTLADLATAWLELMAVVSGRVEELGLPVGPPEGEAFYHALVAAIAEALDTDDRLGDKLREAWPGLGAISAEHDGDAPTPRPPTRRWRVVIADDSRDLRAVFRIALEQDGRFEVVGEAADGRQAVARCAELQPDLLLLDLVMPHVDGWSALTTIRKEQPGVLVIVVSTLDEAMAADRAAELGAAAYVQKSISLVTLTDTLAELADAS
jgi:CheY-like chemotaxis protein